MAARCELVTEEQASALSKTQLGKQTFVRAEQSLWHTSETSNLKMDEVFFQQTCRSKEHHVSPAKKQSSLKEGSQEPGETLHFPGSFTPSIFLIKG